MQRRPYAKQGKEPTILCNQCDNISSKLKYVEDKIVEGLRYWLEDYQLDKDTVLQSKCSKNITYCIDAIEQIHNQIENSKKELDRVCDAYEKGIYAADIYQDRYQKHLDKQKALEVSLKEYQEQLGKEYAILEQKELMIPKLQNVLDIYYELESAEDKNNLLKTVVEKVTYLKEKPALKKTDDPMEFKIRIYPKLPKT